MVDHKELTFNLPTKKLWLCVLGRWLLLLLHSTRFARSSLDREAELINSGSAAAQVRATKHKTKGRPFLFEDPGRGVQEL